MSGSLGRPASTSSCKTSKQSLIFSSSAYSTFAGRCGRGRGGGRGSSGPPDPSSFAAQTLGKPDPDAEAEDAFFPSGLGHGRGKPIPSTPILPSFSSWMSAVSPPAGRGIVQTTQPQPDPCPSESEGFEPKKPLFFSWQHTQKPKSSDSVLKLDEDILPSSLLPGLPGAGHGNPPKTSPSPNERAGTEENRHLRSRRGGAVSVQDRTSPSPPRFSREDAVKKAVRILSRGRGDGMEDGGRGRGLRGRGGWGRAGRGMQGWRGRDGRSAGRFRDAEEDYATGLR